MLKANHMTCLAIIFIAISIRTRDPYSCWATGVGHIYTQALNYDLWGCKFTYTKTNFFWKSSVSMYNRSSSIWIDYTSYVHGDVAQLSHIYALLKSSELEVLLLTSDRIRFFKWSQTPNCYSPKGPLLLRKTDGSTEIIGGRFIDRPRFELSLDVSASGYK